MESYKQVTLNLKQHRLSFLHFEKACLVNGWLSGRECLFTPLAHKEVVLSNKTMTLNLKLHTNIETQVTGCHKVQFGHNRNNDVENVCLGIRLTLLIDVQAGSTVSQ